MTKSKRILIVDDDLLSIANVSQTLLLGGYETIHATSRRGAIKAIRRDQPDLVICNLDGRKIDAHQLIQFVKEEREARGIPFLFLVGSHRMPDPAPEILGPKQYLKKPFTHEELASAVHDHLDRRRHPGPQK
jgi:CheY-like chemotaxis protein